MGKVNATRKIIPLKAKETPAHSFFLPALFSRYLAASVGEIRIASRYAFLALIYTVSREKITAEIKNMGFAELL